MPPVTVVHPRGETTRSVSSLAELNAYVINRGWGLQTGDYAAAYQTVTGQAYAPAAADATGTGLAPLPLSLRPDALSAPVGPAPAMVAQACQPGHGWASTGNGGTVNLNDASDTTFGSQCITLTTDGTNTTQTHVTRSGLTLDMSGKSFVLWVMCPDVSRLKSIELRLGDATWANFFYLEPESQRTASQGDRWLQSGRWQRFVFPWSVFETSVGTPSRAAIAQVRITPKDYANGNPAVLRVAGFGTQPEQAIAVCSFTVDDGWSEQWNLFRPILNGKGWPATAFPIVNLLGTGAGTYMTLAQVRDLQEVHGWEIGAHAYTAAVHNATGGFTGVSDTALDADLAALKQWLVDNNFNGRDYLAYPQGFNDTRTITIARRYFAAARTQSQYRRETLPTGDRMRTRTVNLGTGPTLATITALVDEAVANREWINFTGHRLAATAENGSTWRTVDFQGLCDYIAGQNIRVLTYGQALRSVAP